MRSGKKLCGLKILKKTWVSKLLHQEELSIRCYHIKQFSRHIIVYSVHPGKDRTECQYYFSESIGGTSSLLFLLVLSSLVQ